MKNLNNKQVRALAAVAVLTVILASAGLASAQGCRPGKSMGQDCYKGEGDVGPGHRIEMMAKHLELSEEQLTTITKIHEGSRKDGLEKRKELMRLRNELQGEMLKDNPSEKTVLGINEQMGTLKTEMKALQLKTRLAVREELTQEQRDQMLMMHDQGRKGGRKGHRGHGGSSKGCGTGKAMGARNNIDCRINQ